MSEKTGKPEFQARLLRAVALGDSMAMDELRARCPSIARWRARAALLGRLEIDQRHLDESLVVAVSAGRRPSVLLLLRAGARPQGGGLKTALSEAATQKDIRLLRAVVGAYSPERSELSRALFLAAARGFTAGVQFLVECGADVAGEAGFSPLAAAEGGGFSDCAALLRQLRAEKTPITG
jgi:hypothetical protein